MSCQPCPLGFFSGPGASSCTQCAVGQPASAQGCGSVNAQLTLSFSIAPSGGALLPAAAVASPAVVAQIGASFAALLSLPASHHDNG